MHMPENGFYYHYKHNPSGSVENYAYEVIGIARHTEIQDAATDKFVIYRKLGQSSYTENGKYMCARPLAMFFETVEKDGKTFPRFQKITDPAIIAKLAAIRDGMYSGGN